MVLWWSGLRGGVAFALAAAGFARLDFPQHCGGLRPGHRKSSECLTEADGVADMSDSLALLQTTLLVATFSIFFLGGSITDVAVRCDVLRPATESREHRSTSWSDGSDLLSRIDRRLVRPWLTIAGNAAAVSLGGIDLGSVDLAPTSTDPSPRDVPFEKEYIFAPGGPTPPSWLGRRHAWLRKTGLVLLLLPALVWFQLNRELTSACDETPGNQLLWVVPGAEPVAAPSHPLRAVLFGQWRLDGFASAPMETASRLGLSRTQADDCTVGGGPSGGGPSSGRRLLGTGREGAGAAGRVGNGAGQLAGQLRRCMKHGLVVDNSTIVWVQMGPDDLVPVGGSGGSAAVDRAVHGLLAHRHSQLLELAFGRLLNFSHQVCETHGCPRAFVVAPPPIEYRKVASALHLTTTRAHQLTVSPPHHLATTPAHYHTISSPPPHHDLTTISPRSHHGR